jgi:NTE family protein
MNRVNEISFNSSLMREMRAISFVTKLVDDSPDEFKTLKRMLVHSIAADEIMTELGAASKLNGDWDFLTYLRDQGRDHATSGWRRTSTAWPRVHHRHPQGISLTTLESGEPS